MMGSGISFRLNPGRDRKQLCCIKDVVEKQKIGQHWQMSQGWAWHIGSSCESSVLLPIFFSYIFPALLWNTVRLTAIKLNRLPTTCSWLLELISNFQILLKSRWIPGMHTEYMRLSDTKSSNCSPSMTTSGTRNDGVDQVLGLRGVFTASTAFIYFLLW